MNIFSSVNNPYPSSAQYEYNQLSLAGHPTQYFFNIQGKVSCCCFFFQSKSIILIIRHSLFVESLVILLICPFAFLTCGRYKTIFFHDSTFILEAIKLPYTRKYKTHIFFATSHTFFFRTVMIF
jgi:hypothetical protein